MTKKSGHTTRQKLVLLRSVFEAVDEIVNNNKILEKVLEKINRENVPVNKHCLILIGCEFQK
jgi:hypothetical protein